MLYLPHSLGRRDLWAKRSWAFDFLISSAIAFQAKYSQQNIYQGLRVA